MIVNNSAAVILVFLGVTTQASLPITELESQTFSKPNLTSHHVCKTRCKSHPHIRPAFVHFTPLPPFNRPTSSCLSACCRPAHKTKTHHASKIKTRAEKTLFTRDAQVSQPHHGWDSKISCYSKAHSFSAETKTKTSTDFYAVSTATPTFHVVPVANKYTLKQPTFEYKESITITATATLTSTITATTTLTLPKAREPVTTGIWTAKGPNETGPKTKTKGKKKVYVFDIFKKGKGKHQASSTLNKREQPTARRSAVAPTRTVSRTTPNRKPANKHVSEPVSKPFSKPVSKPVNKPVSEPANKPVSEPANKPASKSVGLNNGNSTRAFGFGSGSRSGINDRVIQTTYAQPLQPAIVPVGDAAPQLLRAATAVFTMAGALAVLLL